MRYAHERFINKYSDIPRLWRWRRKQSRCRSTLRVLTRAIRVDVREEDYQIRERLRSAGQAPPEVETLKKFKVLPRRFVTLREGAAPRASSAPARTPSGGCASHVE